MRISKEARTGRLALPGRRIAVFRTIEYTIEHPVDLKTGCPCQRDGPGSEPGALLQGRAPADSEETPDGHAERTHFIPERGSAPRRGSSAFFGAWTDTREG
jgi:hypothetical protein